jgi:hypothetical protein
MSKRKRWKSTSDSGKAAQVEKQRQVEKQSQVEEQRQ